MTRVLCIDPPPPLNRFPAEGSVIAKRLKTAVQIMPRPDHSHRGSQQTLRSGCYPAALGAIAGGGGLAHPHPPRTPTAPGRQLSFSRLQPVRLGLPVSAYDPILNLTA